MPGPRDSTSFKISGWLWGAVGAILAAVPIVLALGVPGTPAPAPSPAPAAPRTSHDAEYDALEAEMAILRGEKSAIEAEETRLRGVRDELEAFDRDHPDGVPPELFARYEDLRATYNSDVKAYKSRAGAYQMKVAELERRVEALRDGAPAAP